MTRTAAVARLAAEFVVIVVGVLVALAVDSWAQDREDREDELAYLSELSQDLAATLEDAERVLALEAGISRSLTLLIDGLASPSAASADSLAHWLDTALRTSGSLYRPGAPTADALIETGDIALIEDHQIRRLVLTHRERVHQVAAVFNVLDEASLDVIASLNGRVDRLALSRGDVDWMVVAADPVVRGDLYTQLTAVDARHAYTDYLLQSVRPLITALEERVGSP